MANSYVISSISNLSTKKKQSYLFSLASFYVKVFSRLLLFSLSNSDLYYKLFDFIFHLHD